MPKPTTPTTVAWSTLPPDEAHVPVWGKQHLTDDCRRKPGSRTLCGKQVADFYHEMNAGRTLDPCGVCHRVLECRKKGRKTS